MTAPLSWTFRQLAVFWVAAILIAVILWMIGARLQPGPWKFLWLIPARNPAYVLWLVTREFFRIRPFQAAAIVAVPFATIIVTATWVVGRLAR